ncbi:MAG: hypothetical protein RLN76_03155 [Phycisphaeraceae bacterium]
MVGDTLIGTEDVGAADQAPDKIKAIVNLVIPVIIGMTEGADGGLDHGF